MIRFKLSMRPCLLSNQITERVNKSEKIKKVNRLRSTKCDKNITLTVYICLIASGNPN